MKKKHKNRSFSDEFHNPESISYYVAHGVARSPKIGKLHNYMRMPFHIWATQFLVETLKEIREGNGILFLSFHENACTCPRSGSHRDSS